MGEEATEAREKVLVEGVERRGHPCYWLTLTSENIESICHPWARLSSEAIVMKRVHWIVMKSKNWLVEVHFCVLLVLSAGSDTSCLLKYLYDSTKRSLFKKYCNF